MPGELQWLLCVLAGALITAMYFILTHVYEFEPTLLHQKIVIVDGVWAHVGSSNFDSRSLELNAEVGIGLLDRKVASQLKSAFQDDLRRSRELTLETWRQRSSCARVLDWIAYQAWPALIDELPSLAPVRPRGALSLAKFPRKM